MTLDLPAPIDAADVEIWSDEVDVVVVGFGIAGACAALEAARAGASVILLERAAEYGGTSAMSGGHFYLGGGTAVQQATGIEDSAEEMFKYLMAVSLEPDEDKIRAFCEDSVEHFDWIEALGMEFERSLYEEKAVIQPGTQGLMYTGNEKVHPFRDLAKPAPRGHKVPAARRHRRRQDGARPARRADRRDRRRGALRDGRQQPGRPGRPRGRRCGRRPRLAQVRRARRDPCTVGGHRRRWLRRQRHDGPGVHAAARRPSCSRSPRPTTTGSASASAPRWARSCDAWSRPSSPRRSTRPRSWSPGSW